MIRVQIEAAGREQLQFIVVSELECLIYPGSGDRSMDGLIHTQRTDFCCIQLPNTEDNRSMTLGLLVVQKVRVQTRRAEE